MTDQWFFAWDGHRLGPYSAAQLRKLAELGKIQPLDTVWEGAEEKGVPADQVANLFPDLQPAGEGRADIVPEGLTMKTIPEDQPGGAEPVHPADAPPAASTISTPRTPAPAPAKRKGRATAVRGAVIISQDGDSVRFQKKCTKCGQKENTCSTMQIPSGMSIKQFFCPKCRKLRPVEIQGVR